MMTEQFIADASGVHQVNAFVAQESDPASWWSGYSTHYQKNLTPENALSHGLLWCGLNLIAGDLAQVPYYVRRGTDAGPVDAPTHPLWRILTVQPNQWQTPYELFEWIALTKIVWGNALVRIRRSRTGGNVIALEPIPMRFVEWFTDDDGMPFYAVHWPGGTESLTTSEVLHFRGLGSNGFWGRSLMDVAQDEISLTRDAMRHAATTFRNGGRPDGVLKHPGKLSDSERANLRADWQAVHGGADNAGKIAVLWSGMDWTPLSSTNVDAQMIEMLSHDAVLVGRLLQLSPLMLGDLRYSATRANVEEARRAYYLETLSRHVASITQQLNSKLIRNPAFAIHADASEVQKGDMKTRVEVASMAVGARVWNQNEARDYTGRNLVEGGDVFANPAVDTQESLGQESRAAHVAEVEQSRLATGARKRRNFIDFAERFYASGFVELATEAWPGLSKESAEQYAQQRLEAVVSEAGEFSDREELAKHFEAADSGEWAEELTAIAEGRS